MSLLIKMKTYKKGPLNSEKRPENLIVGWKAFYEAMVKIWRGIDAQECTYSALNIQNLKIQIYC